MSKFDKSTATTVAMNVTSLHENMEERYLNEDRYFKLEKDGNGNLKVVWKVTRPHELVTGRVIYKHQFVVFNISSGRLFASTGHGVNNGKVKWSHRNIYDSISYCKATGILRSVHEEDRSIYNAVMDMQISQYPFVVKKDIENVWCMDIVAAIYCPWIAGTVDMSNVMYDCMRHLKTPSYAKTVAKVTGIAKGICSSNPIGALRLNKLQLDPCTSNKVLGVCKEVRYMSNDHVGHIECFLKSYRLSTDVDAIVYICETYDPYDYRARSVMYINDTAQMLSRYKHLVSPEVFSEFVADTKHLGRDYKDHESIIELHDLLEKEIGKVMQKPIQIQYGANDMKLEVGVDGYDFILPKWNVDCISNANKHRHCAGSAYTEDVIAGKYRLVHLTMKGKLLVTLGIRKVEGKFVLEQAKCHCNKVADANGTNLIIKYCVQVGIQHNKCCDLHGNGIDIHCGSNVVEYTAYNGKEIGGELCEAGMVDGWNIF